MIKYSVSKYFRFTLGCALIGVFCLFFGLTGLFRLYHATYLDMSSLNHLHAGNYVHCSVEQYFVTSYQVPESGEIRYTGYVDAIKLGIGQTKKIYPCFYVYVGKDKMIPIGILSADILLQLDTFENGCGGPIHLTGKIYRNFSKSARNSAYDMLNSKYMIIQVDETVEKTDFIFFIYVGTLAFIGAVMLFRFGAGITAVIVTPFEETMEYKKLARGTNYALKEEYNSAVRYLEDLRNRQRSIMNLKWGGLLIIFLGLGLMYAAVNGHVLWVYQYHVLILGFVVILVGVDCIWQSFINSNYPLAVKISDKFTLNTYSVKIEKASIIVSVLYRRLEEELKKQNLKNYDYF